MSGNSKGSMIKPGYNVILHRALIRLEKYLWKCLFVFLEALLILLVTVGVAFVYNRVMGTSERLSQRYQRGPSDRFFKR